MSEGIEVSKKDGLTYVKVSEPGYYTVKVEGYINSNCVSCDVPVIGLKRGRFNGETCDDKFVMNNYSMGDAFLQAIGDKPASYRVVEQLSGSDFDCVRALKIPSCERIEDGFLSGATELRTLILPDDGSLTAIGDGAFEHCQNLLYVVIPKSVKYIGKNAFRQCYNALYIAYPASAELGEGAFGTVGGAVHVTGRTFASRRPVFASAGLDDLLGPSNSYPSDENPYPGQGGITEPEQGRTGIINEFAPPKVAEDGFDAGKLKDEVFNSLSGRVHEISNTKQLDPVDNKSYSAEVTQTHWLRFDAAQKIAEIGTKLLSSDNWLSKSLNSLVSMVAEFKELEIKPDDKIGPLKSAYNTGVNALCSLYDFAGQFAIGLVITDELSGPTACTQYDAEKFVNENVQEMTEYDVEMINKYAHGIIDPLWDSLTRRIDLSSTDISPIKQHIQDFQETVVKTTLNAIGSALDKIKLDKPWWSWVTNIIKVFSTLVDATLAGIFKAGEYLVEDFLAHAMATIEGNIFSQFSDEFWKSEDGKRIKSNVDGIMHIVNDIGVYIVDIYKDVQKLMLELDVHKWIPAYSLVYATGTAEGTPEVSVTYIPHKRIVVDEKGNIVEKSESKALKAAGETDVKFRICSICGAYIYDETAIKCPECFSIILPPVDPGDNEDTPTEPGAGTGTQVKPAGEPINLGGCPLPPSEKPAACGYRSCPWLSCVCMYPPPPEEETCEICLSGYTEYQSEGGKLSKDEWHNAGHPAPEYKKQVSCDYINAEEKEEKYTATDTMQKTYADADSVRQYEFVCNMFDLSDKRDQNISNVKKMFDQNTMYTQAKALDHDFIGVYTLETAVQAGMAEAAGAKPDWCPGPKDLP